MRVNIYDSMASVSLPRCRLYLRERQRSLDCVFTLGGCVSLCDQGVSKAAVVIAFISQRYQDSDNCKLELTLAKQNKVPIVPVKMQANWSATEWLGAVTAGLLYTPMHDQTTMQQNLPGLIGQIKAAVKTVEVAGDVESPRAATADSSATNAISGGESEDVLALRGELDRLRQDLAEAVTHTQRTVAGGAASKVAETTLAPVPAEVPSLSLNVRPTHDMQKLKQMLLSDDSDDSTMAVTSTKMVGDKIGAMGMGGIGKTVTATWLARDADVRKHFEAVCWCASLLAPASSSFSNTRVRVSAGALWVRLLILTACEG